MENVIAEIKKMEKEKSLQLEKLEQLQFRKGIATTRKAEISEQIKTVNNFKVCLVCSLDSNLIYYVLYCRLRRSPTGPW